MPAIVTAIVCYVCTQPSTAYRRARHNEHRNSSIVHSHDMFIGVVAIVQYGAFISEVNQFCGGYVLISNLKAECYNGLKGKV